MGLQYFSDKTWSPRLLRPTFSGGRRIKPPFKKGGCGDLLGLFIAYQKVFGFDCQDESCVLLLFLYVSTPEITQFL